MNKEQILDEILNQAIFLSNKKGKKLSLANGICGQLYLQGVMSNSDVRMIHILEVVNFFIRRADITEDRHGFLPRPGQWTQARKKLLSAIIEGLEDPKVRRQMTEHAIGF